MNMVAVACCCSIQSEKYSMNTNVIYWMPQQTNETKNFTWNNAFSTPTSSSCNNILAFVYLFVYLSPFTLSKLDQGKDKDDFVQVCMQKSYSAALGSWK